MRGASTAPLRGMPKPAASNSAPSAAAKPSPATMPINEADAADQQRLAGTAPTICVRVAPSERSSANSRTRWATVIENVLKMMNAPTSSAAPAARAASA